MARVLSDAFTIAKGLWGMIDNRHVKFSIASSAATAVVTLASSFGNKAVRLISRDPTPYVGWSDLEGQIDRLANDRFEAIRGALAPTAIYDRRAMFAGSWNFFSSVPYRSLQQKSVVFLGGTALLGIAALSLHDCNRVGDHADPATAGQCWNQLGQHILEPTTLSMLSFGYALTSMSTVTLLMGLAPFLSSVLMMKMASNGFTIGPTFLKNQDILLTQRYQALATNFLGQWKKVSESKNAEEISQVVKLATLIQRKSSMLSLALEEYFSVSKSVSETIMKPLVDAAKKIIEDAAKAEIQEPIIIKKAEEL